MVSAAVSRRRFLRDAAVAGAAAAGTVAGGWALRPFAAAGATTVRVAVVPPSFGQGLSASWLNGLRLAFAGAPAVVVDTAAPALGSLQVAAASRRLALAGADIIVGAVTPQGARDVARALRGTPALFLNAEPGAQILRPGDYEANVFHHSLHLWQANYATGVWAAQAIGSRAATLSAYLESGYDTVAAFAMGFTAGGGQITGETVSHVPGRSQTVNEVLAGLQAGQPDFVYINASGARAEELLEAAPRALAAPFARAAGQPDAAFSRAYSQANGTPADAFALLGYEAGSLILAAREHSRHSGDDLRAGLAEASFDSPRGMLRMDRGSHASTAEAYVDRAGAALPWLAKVSEPVALAHAGWEQAVSGWSLPYATVINRKA